MSIPRYVSLIISSLIRSWQRT